MPTPPAARRCFVRPLLRLERPVRIPAHKIRHLHDYAHRHITPHSQNAKNRNFGGSFLPWTKAGRAKKRPAPQARG
jgi:hypothetical protein